MPQGGTNDDTLTCTHCPKSCGTRVETSIAVSACSSFGNNGGTLVCDAPPNGPGIPGGTYSDSCGGCTISRPFLTGFGQMYVRNAWLVSPLGVLLALAAAETGPNSKTLIPNSRAIRKSRVKGVW